MAEINTSIGARRRKRLGCVKHQHPKTDMTPMVDLGFLLISFFVITTEMSQPRTTDFFVPKPSDLRSTLGDSNALTFLLAKDNTVYYYHGNWKDAFAKGLVTKIAGDQKRAIREVVIRKQQYLDQHNKKEGRDGLMFLIKPGKDAFYGNVIDVLDEALIHNVKKYAVLPIEAGEASFLEKKPG
jgi:biopolymer transport protein ExbD